MSKSQPSILKRLVTQLEAKGHSSAEAHAIAVKALQKAGDLKPGSTEPTAKGIRRGLMTASDRAKDRAAKYNGGQPSDYKYNSRTNLAIKRK